jgi:hypothetical protein
MGITSKRFSCCSFTFFADVLERSLYLALPSGLLSVKFGSIDSYSPMTTLRLAREIWRNN